MSDSTVTQITRLDPRLEAQRLGMLESVKAQIDRDRAANTRPPDYQIAGLGPNGQLMSQAEMAALQQAQQGVGQFAPFLQGGFNVWVRASRLPAWASPVCSKRCKPQERRSQCWGKRSSWPTKRVISLSKSRPRPAQGWARPRSLAQALGFRV